MRESGRTDSRLFRARWLLTVAAVLLPGFCCAAASVTASIVVNGSEQGTDASSITLAFNGFTETVNYDWTSTQNSVASAFAAMFSRDYLSSGLCASATGNTISVQLAIGTFTPIAITGSTTSFQIAATGFATLTSSPAAVPVFSPYVNDSPPGFSPPTAYLIFPYQTISITSSTAGAAIYYTINGGIPTTSSLAYTGPFPVAQTAIMEAIAVAPGAVPSGVAAASYLVYPIPHRTLTLTNTGTKAMTITTISITGAGANNFLIEDNTCGGTGSSQVVVAGGNCSLVVDVFLSDQAPTLLWLPMAKPKLLHSWHGREHKHFLEIAGFAATDI